MLALRSQYTVAVGHECLIPSPTECRANKPSHVMSIGFMSLGVKRLGREADQLLPSIAEGDRVRYFIKHSKFHISL